MALITLEIPDTLLEKLDAANEAARLEPPTWPFEQLSIVKQLLSSEEKQQLISYQNALEAYNQKKESNGGKNTRSRSTLITKILVDAAADLKRWEQLVQI